jgi:outer membrane protein insertion porin family
MLPRILVLSVLWQGAVLSQTSANKKTTPKAAPVPVAATRTPATPGKYPIREILVTGIQNLTEAQVIAASGLVINQLAAKQDLDAAKDRLVATGMFETVGYRFGPTEDGKGYVATFEVVEIQTLFPVQFENLPEPSGEIEAFLKARNPMFGPKIPGTAQVIDSYARLISEFLASRNHAANVIGQLIQTGRDQFKVNFRTSDPLPPVTSVSFSGNKTILSVNLQKAINDVAFGQPFSNDAFRMLLDNQIRALYDARGMLRVKFTNFTTEPDPRLKGVTVHVTVDEGPVYKLAKVTLTGADSSLLKSAAKIETGDTADFDLVKEGLARVKQELKKEGYLRADGDFERVVDDKALSVDVVLKMEKGPLYTFGKLTIQGLDLNGEPAVRKMWGVQQGKPFNALYPDYFLKRVRDEGMFDGLGETKSKTDIDETTHIANVTLIFGAVKPADKRKRPDQDPLSIPHPPELP